VFALWLKKGSKLIFAAMYLRRVETDGSSYAAAPMQVSTVVTPPTPAAQNPGMKNGGAGVQRICRSR